MVLEKVVRSRATRWQGFAWRWQGFAWLLGALASLLVLLEDMPLTDALRAISTSRGRVLTNRSFRAQLLDIAARTGRLQ